MARRIKGQIFQEKTSDGKPTSWRVRVTIIEEDGKRRAPQRSYRTRKEAEAGLREWLTELENGTAVEPSRQTVGAYLASWLAGARHTVRPSTHASYDYLVKTYIVPALGAVPLQKLAGQRIKDFYAAKLADGGRASARPGGLSPRTVRYIHAVLRRALEEAKRLRLIPHNPADDVTPPRGKRPPIKSWDADGAQRFLEVVKDDKYRLLWQLALHTGMRRGELLGLRWEDVDMPRGTLHVRETRIMVGKTIDKSEPKTESGKRTIALDHEDVAALKEHRAAQLALRLEKGWRDNDFVFISEAGTGLDPMNVYHRFVTLMERAGVPRIPFHGLRHTCATVAMRNGVNPKVVQELLGHSDIAMTLGTYSHVMPEMHQEAATTIAAAMRRQG